MRRTAKCLSVSRLDSGMPFLFWLTAIVVLIGLGGREASLQAAPPVNDTCAGALVLSSAGPFPVYSAGVDITDATTTGENLTNSCEFFTSASSRSTWYSFTPADDGQYLFSVCADFPTGTTVEDTIMAVYTSANGCNGPFVEVAGGCNDDACGPTGLQSALQVALTAGVTYYVVVWKFNDEAPPPGGRSLQLAVTPMSIPDNDTCAGVEEIFLNLPVRGSTLGAANDYQLSGSACFLGDGNQPSTATGRDVVYTFTAPEAGLYSFRVNNYRSSGDLVVYVADQCPGGPGPSTVTGCLSAANRNPVSSAESVVCLPLGDQEQVYVFVDEDAGGGGSAFFLEATLCVPESEPNGSFETANPIDCPITGSIEGLVQLDYFALGDLPAGSRVFAALDGESANVPDFDLRIVHTNVVVEYDDNNSATLYGDTSPAVAGALVRDGGETFIQVNFNGVSAGPYFLYHVIQPPLTNATEETEPNDLVTEANTGQNLYFYGILEGPGPSQDLDVFSFEAQASDLIYLGLDGDPLKNNTPISPKLELLNADGDVILTVNDASNSSITNQTPDDLDALFPTFPSESLLYRVPEGGTFYARVSIGEDTTEAYGVGDYLLSVSLNCGTGVGGTNHPPVLSDLVAVSPVERDQTTSISGLLTDLDLMQQQSLVIDWQDGTRTTNVYEVFGQEAFSVDHVYADTPQGTQAGVYFVTVTVTDSEGGQDTAFLPILVTRGTPVRIVSIEKLPNGNPLLRFEGQPFRTYTIQSGPDIMQWNNRGSITADGDGLFQWEDTATPLPATRFYRAFEP